MPEARAYVARVGKALYAAPSRHASGGDLGHVGVEGPLVLLGEFHKDLLELGLRIILKQDVAEAALEPRVEAIPDEGGNPRYSVAFRGTQRLLEAALEAGAESVQLPTVSECL